MDGGFVFVWVHAISSDTHLIMGQRFSAEGERVRDETVLSQGDQELHFGLTAIELSDGVISVNWGALVLEDPKAKLKQGFF